MRKTWNLAASLALCCFALFALFACSDSSGPLDADLDAPADSLETDPPDTTVAPPDTTIAPPDTTVTPPDTTVTPPPDPSTILADHFSVADFLAIPDSSIAKVATDLSIFYGHTSHGSQLMRGLSMLLDEDSKYVRPHIQERSGDLGHNGSLAWNSTTRAFLADNPGEYNVVMWSWCGGCSDNTDEGIDIYLDAMNQLELDFPDIVFVYMTGHLDGSGVDGPLYRSNNRIRDYCAENEKVLYDFADIESYDPDGVYYPDESDGCGWAEQWCQDNDCPDCDYCAHSRCFNCYLKGKAFWWMMARIVGWDGE